MDHSNFSRRFFMQQMAFAAASLSTPGLWAEELTTTPRMTEGPFYPDKLPLDTDNDLLILNDSLTAAAGEVTHLSGRILSAAGEPIRNAFVEIWQVDHNGAYINSNDPRLENRDTNFQGYGRFLTDVQGRYYFRTIKPVPYPGRTPHIHLAVSKNGQRIWTTQLLVNGHDQNAQDGLFRRITDPKLQKLVLADFKPIKGSKTGELAVNWDVVIGWTPADEHETPIQGGIGKPEWRQRR
ncbi:protocatechuate 3,4-dioxygenase [Planctomycetaceae bacterium]|jgi:protocatechuate 3,4-dioxygenase, beta subunit|nr:protocatechuate 3,4-dioxygenase [Planctomycetaceae bacterium]